MLRHILTLLLCAVLILTGASCGLLDPGEEASPAPPEPTEPEIPPPPPEFPVRVGGTTVLSRPGRVVSLSPSITEKIYDLGLEDRLVGVSRNCDYPAAAELLDRCGTAQMPDTETIGNLRAHLVVTEIPLPDEDRAELSRMDIDVVVIPRAQSLDGLRESYIGLARMFEGEHAGQEMGDMFVDAVWGWLSGLGAAVEAQMNAQDAQPKPALYIRMTLEENAVGVVATGDTLENDIMSLIGLRNIAADQTGWYYPEELASGDSLPDFQALRIIFFDEEYIPPEDFGDSAFYRNLQAVQSGLLLHIDSNIMERQSLRTFEQLLAMARSEHVWPESDFPRWPPRITYALN
ncbi:MAG: helical backbone metal receptor [Oscillospiraceae bacterium]|nr:helical backbone metal receptor [Oscillospiraceae bacterium]